MKFGRMLEFFIVGLVLGILEDVIAIGASTDVSITWNTIGIIGLVALPFAVFSELIVDKFKLFNNSE
jgi:hypothetical protein